MQLLYVWLYVPECTQWYCHSIWMWEITHSYQNIVFLILTIGQQLHMRKLSSIHPYYVQFPFQYVTLRIVQPQPYHWHHIACYHLRKWYQWRFIRLQSPTFSQNRCKSRPPYTMHFVIKHVLVANDSPKMSTIFNNIEHVYKCKFELLPGLMAFSKPK